MSPATLISDSQLTANRQNAQSSTGPRTEAGKTRTRLNGLRHGLTGQTVVMPYEDRDAYDRFCAEAIADLEPATAPELALASAIADGEWRLSRARAIEDNIFALDLEAANSQSDTEAALTQAQTWLDHNREINLLTLYAGRIARAVAKNKLELRHLQNDRQQAEKIALEEAILLAQHAKSEFPESASRTCPGECAQPEILLVDGFAFSTEDLDRIIHRRQRLSDAIAYSKSTRKAS